MIYLVIDISTTASLRVLFQDDAGLHLFTVHLLEQDQELRRIESISFVLTLHVSTPPFLIAVHVLALFMALLSQKIFRSC
jgi:hypothetical protein